MATDSTLQKIADNLLAQFDKTLLDNSTDFSSCDQILNAAPSEHKDELVQRMEIGIPVFGMPLRIYQKRGVYGRQFVLRNGRLDILGIDTAGDLYVIELKKDSGYDDAYAQTREYIDWIEEDVAVKGQRVFGIICLNDPTKDLIEKVKADDQMRLFEYSISYSEII